MKKHTIVNAFSVGPVCLLLLSGCAQWGRGTPGSDDVQIASGSGVGEPYPIGNRSPFQHTGMPDASIAASRAEASLDVSGAGSAELARRSAAATEPDSARLSAPIDADRAPNGDASLLERIRLALRSKAITPGAAPSPVALSMEELNDINITVKDRVVTLDGTVQNDEKRGEIGKQVQAVPGVKQVNNDLKVR